MKREWSRDWTQFDWSQVKRKLEAMQEGDEKAGHGVGITREEFLEYLNWLRQNDNDGYYKAVLSMQLAEIGLNDSQIETLVSHPDELKKIVELVLRK